MSSYTYQGIQFHFEVEGSGFPLLFFHGLGGDWTQSSTTLEHVHGFEKVFIDARGHGSTHPLGPSEKLNFHQFAEDALAIAQHLGYERFIAGGKSMGSATAIRLALLFPQCIEALILVRPAWMNEPYPSNLKVVMLIGELLQKHDPAHAKRIFMEREEYVKMLHTAPAAANSLIGQFDVPNAGEFASRLVTIPASTPFDDDKDLARIGNEALIIGTGQDPIHPLWMTEELAEKMPAARLCVVTSKSEDANKHDEELSYHIDQFLNKYKAAT
jgi:pimeloyl-ACP methyl ester carboxylesterase